MEWIEQINSTINSIVWGPPMLILLVGTGIFVTFLTKFFQVTKIKLWWSGTFGQLLKKQEKKDDVNITPFQAVSTALASTVGTGNIVGVATAIVSGGAGAVFWMWVSAFFGMMTKYCEIVLSLKYRETAADGTYRGGPMYYIKNGLGEKWGWMGTLFAVFGAFACFGIGNMTQANSIVSTIQETTGVSPLISGIVLAAIVALVVIGGIKRIASVTEKLVPFMAIFYIVGGVLAIVLNIGRLGPAFGEIFAGAFSFKAVGGGVMGYVIMQAMRFGFARGVFSNEAGLGSAPIAHAASSTKDPCEQGLWGVFEVFVDTLVVCSITGLNIVMSGLYTTGDLKGAPLTMAAFGQTLGGFAGIFLTIAIACFAGSTILGWSYYGERCVDYLTKGNKTILLIYKLIFVGLIIVGSVGGLTLIWDIADTLNGLMALPNLIAVVLLSKVVISETKRFLGERKLSL